MMSNLGVSNMKAPGMQDFSRSVIKTF